MNQPQTLLAPSVPTAPGFKTYAHLRLARDYQSVERAREVSAEYTMATGRQTTVSPEGGYWAVKDGDLFVGPDRTTAWTFRNRPVILTDRDPVTANDYRLGQMPGDIAKVWYHDDLAGAYGMQPWVEVIEARYNLALPTAEVCLLLRRANGVAFERYVAGDHVLFGERA